MALPLEKNSRLHCWPDYALFVVVVAFCVFSAKAFTRSQAHVTPTREKISRGLASVVGEQPVPERSTHTVALGCLDEKAMRTKTEASLLRVTATGCGNQVLRATNQSTGESLMVFERNGGISTHYFPLKTGTNKILIEWKGAKKSAKILEVEKTL